MAISIFKVIYHYELGSYGGKRHASETFQDHVAAANGLPATLGPILDAAGRNIPPGHVRVFDSVANAGPGTALS